MAVPSNYAALVTAIDAILTTYGLSLFQVFGGRSTQPSLRELISLRWKLFSMTTPANYATLIAEIDVVIESYGLSLQEVFGGRSTQPTLQELIDLRYELFEVDGGGIDLTAPPTNIGTVTPPAITVSTLFRSANSGNVPFIAQPSGTGAFQLQQTDNTATGGNARGANAVDLQMVRSSATQVASGANSFIFGSGNTASGASSFAAGSSNTASGADSIAIGSYNISSLAGSVCIGSFNNSSGQYSAAIGQSNAVSNYASIAAGLGNLSNGAVSTAFGRYASAKGISNILVLGNPISPAVGSGQASILSLGAITTDATPTILNSDTSATSVSNQLVLQNNSAITFTALVTATTTSAGDCSSWEFKGQIQRGANAASTALVAAITPALIAQKAGASGWAVAVTADTTNGCLTVTVTGQASTTIRWNCTIFASEVAF